MIDLYNQNPVKSDAVMLYNNNENSQESQLLYKKVGKNAAKIICVARDFDPKNIKYPICKEIIWKQI
jgi:hypothetical protein